MRTKPHPEQGFRACLGILQLAKTLGLYFQHISNGGQDAVNPGVDAPGPMLGIGWRF